MRNRDNGFAGSEAPSRQGPAAESHESRVAPGKSPSPLSPSPTLAIFRPHHGGGYGPTPSVSPQSQEGTAIGCPYGPGYLQRSPTAMLQSGHDYLMKGNHRSPAMSAFRPAGEGRRSPLTTQYMPPPPMRMPSGGPGRRNIFDDDANAEAAGSPMRVPSPGAPTAQANPNSTVSGSVSPLSEGRFGYLAHNSRPVSAATVHTSPLYGSSACRTAGPAPYREARGVVSMQRAASSVDLARPFRPKTTFCSNCGVIVDEIDSKTGCLLAQYRCGPLLGSGGFAAVFEFTELGTKESYACKVIDKAKLGSHGEEKVRMEVEMHRRMDHPNILRLFKMFSDEHYFYIVLELCSSKNLLEVSNERKALPVAEVQHILRQLTSAVQYMHEKKIIHRDIKLGNIMIDFSGNVKIGDFGFANELTRPNERKMRLCGTPNYIAPEILACNETKVGYGFEVDIWSLGVLLFILAFGLPPFEAKDVPSTYARIRSLDYCFPAAPLTQRGRGSAGGHQVPDSCKALIRQMLSHDPAKRPTPQEILECAFLRTASTVTVEVAAGAPPRNHSGAFAAYRESQRRRENELISQAEAPSQRETDVATHQQQGFTPLQQQHCGSRLVLGGSDAPQWRDRYLSSPFVASPIVRQSPSTCPKGGGSPFAEPAFARHGGGNSGRAGRFDAGKQSSAGHDNEVRELFGSTKETGETEACKTIHEFLQENDPSSATTTGTGTTGSEQTTDNDVDYQAQNNTSAIKGNARASHQQPRRQNHTHGGLRDQWGRGKRAGKLPSAPTVYLRNAVFASKYGYGFTLCDQSDRTKTAMLFNDHTKLVYEGEIDTVHYFTRTRRVADASDPASGSGGATQERSDLFPRSGGNQLGRSPSTVAGKEGDCVNHWFDLPHVFERASRTLRPDPSDADKCGKSAPYNSPAQKKFAITTFLSPFLSGERCDATYPLCRSSLKHLHRAATHHCLFADGSAASGSAASHEAAKDGGATSPDTASLPPCVKVATMTNLEKLTGAYAGVDMVLTAARFSNQACQITMMCTSPCPVSLIPTAETGLIPRDARWRFDILVYPPFHAVFGVETEHSRFYESFYDIRRDVRTTDEGRIFFAGGSSSDAHHEFMLPEELLYVVAELLKSVRCPEDVADCFHYRK